MDEEYEERVLSNLARRKAYRKTYSRVSEFTEQLKEAALAQEKLRWGWVFWQQNRPTPIQLQILTLLKHIASNWWLGYHYLAQFWAVVKVEGQHHSLSTSCQPFCVPYLKHELCWYRKLCRESVCRVHEGAEEEQLGGVGRAYRNKHPESTPDLRLYSTTEYPLRDHAARCRLKGYLALPLFHLQGYECCGVLELLCCGAAMDTNLLSSLNQGLQPTKYKQQTESEIKEMLELAVKAVPQLHLAQFWVSCKQCVNRCCMERASFINARDKIVNLCKDIDKDMLDYLEACEFHNLQTDFICFRRNLCDDSISQNPLAHYARRARLSVCFAIFLQSAEMINNLCVIEFFFQDACGDSSLHMLLRIIEMKLKSFKFVSREQLPEELVFQSWQSNAIFESESLDTFNEMNSSEILKMLNFTKYLGSDHRYSLHPSSKRGKVAWVFCQPTGEEFSAIVQNFMKKMAVKSWKGNKWIVQFWAPKWVDDRCYLETLDQPYAVGCLAKGLASFRKKCMSHQYFVDEEAKEEELGPPGRAFKNGHPEITSDISLYSVKEFPIKDYTVHCWFQEYFVLPVFDKHKSCVGVLEFTGFSFSQIVDIERVLEEAELSFSLIPFRPTLITDEITIGRKQALIEVKDALLMITNIPQLHMLKVWVPYEECGSTNGNSTCMELVLSSKDTQCLGHKLTNQFHWVHVRPRKGIIGLVLESVNKSCFCRNLCEFSTLDQPLAHIERAERADVCFAICLQSSHTGDLSYVLEFFLNQSPKYLESFLNFLLPIMKQQLKSFKYASGKQLGEELVVEVIEFSETNNLTFSEMYQPDVLPITFKSVWYGQMEHQHAEDMQAEYVAEDATPTKQCSVVALDSKETQSGKSRIGVNLSLELLKLHFGKKLDDVAQELGVGKSTIKRACRRYGIQRWPYTEKQARNLSLFEKESTSSNSTPPFSLLDTSLHQESTQHVNVHDETEKVMIKVKYEGDTIRFESRPSSGVSKLFEEVARRLHLQMNTFKLKYMDEDDEEILVSCDDDLLLCPKRRTTKGQTYIQLFVPK